MGVKHSPPFPYKETVTMRFLKRIPPRLILWLLILPVVIYILVTALRDAN